MLARRFAAGESGAALIEFALVLPVLILLVFGITQFGLALNASNDETHLAEVAARYAAVNFNPSTSGQTFAAWVKSQAGTSLSGAGTVCISFPNNTSNVGDPVKVVVTSGTFSWQALSGVMSIAGLPTTMRGSATMRLEAPPSVYGASCA